MRKCTTSKALCGLLTLAVSAVGLRAADLDEPKNYRALRYSSYRVDGGNRDAKVVGPVGRIGVKGGITHGETDEFGSEIAENGVHVHDYHATILHLMGIDHTRLTYCYVVCDFRFTDVHGNVVHDILA